MGVIQELPGQFTSLVLLFDAPIAGMCNERERENICRVMLPEYNINMIRAYDEIVEFIAAGSTSDAVARFEPSQKTKDYVADLIHKEKTSGLTPEEASELDHFLKLEHLMRLAKARAKMLCSQ